MLRTRPGLVKAFLRVGALWAILNRARHSHLLGMRAPTMKEEYLRDR